MIHTYTIDMMNFAFTGCSFTYGEGFSEELRDLYIYDRLVAKHFNAADINFGMPGASNYKIFMNAASALKSENFDAVFVQWSGVNRLWLSPGPDVHVFVNDTKYPDFRYRDLYIAPKELTNFKNLLKLLNHDYQNLLDLIDYCSVLDLLAAQTQTKLIFINGLIFWKDDLCKPLTSDLSACLCNYSKKILNFNNRDDTEIVKYFTKLQEKFKDIIQYYKKTKRRQ
jgi:hypothetical protein